MAGVAPEHAVVGGAVLLPVEEEVQILVVVVIVSRLDVERHPQATGRTLLDLGY